MHLPFPDPRTAPGDRPLAVGGVISPETVLQAYRMGIFPWSNDPPNWWCPDPRGVLLPGQLRITRSLRKTLNKGNFSFTRDQAFEEVMLGCQAPAPGREDSWIDETFLEVYGKLHQQGHAHSVEVWMEGQLVGGLYGMALGGLFTGESMFNLVPDAAKAALVALSQYLLEQEFVLIDTQVLSPLTVDMGAAALPREIYLELLPNLLAMNCEFKPDNSPKSIQALPKIRE